MLEHVFQHYNYYIAIILMMAGFYVVIAAGNLVKKLIGLGIFQTSVLLFYISLAQVRGGVAPILRTGESVVYANPLPHVLMLTAIVVGIATIAVGLAIVVRIKDTYGSIEEIDILVADEHIIQTEVSAHLEDSSENQDIRRSRVEQLAALYSEENENSSNGGQGAL